MSTPVVLGSFIALSPPTVNNAATIIIGTAQCTSTRLPNTTFPEIAAILPIPVIKPNAVDLKIYQSFKVLCVANPSHMVVLNFLTF